MMGELIRKYFREHLGTHSPVSIPLRLQANQQPPELTPADAEHLHETYYKTYGLAIEGLVRHHKIDPLEYNRKVDDALPLENVLHPDIALQKLFSDIDRSKVKLWLFTNAYVTHGERVVRMLGVDGLFDGTHRPAFL